MLPADPFAGRTDRDGGGRHDVGDFETIFFPPAGFQCKGLDRNPRSSDLVDGGCADRAEGGAVDDLNGCRSGIASVQAALEAEFDSRGSGKIGQDGCYDQADETGRAQFEIAGPGTDDAAFRSVFGNDAPVLDTLGVRNGVFQRVEEPHFCRRGNQVKAAGRHRIRAGRRR